MQLTFYFSVLVKLFAETSELSIDVIVCHGNLVDALCGVEFRCLEELVKSYKGNEFRAFELQQAPSSWRW